jgi:ribosomal protein S18 acetylase RimI-like enzyme
MSSRTLYDRMLANLVASWERYAVVAPGAVVAHVAGAFVAAFPAPPERTVYNNAVLDRGLDVAHAHTAVNAIEEVYGNAAIDGYAVWAHESDGASIVALEERGYRVDTSTRAMAMSLPLDAIPVPRPDLRLDPADWHEHRRLAELPDGLLAGLGADDFLVRVAVVDGETVGTAIAYDHGGDCGIYNVVTRSHARRRGIGTSMTALLVHEARERGCTTASLQSTAIAEGVYAAVGFRDLGLFIEYVR